MIDYIIRYNDQVSSDELQKFSNKLKEDFPNINFVIIPDGLDINKCNFEELSKLQKEINEEYNRRYDNHDN